MASFYSDTPYNILIFGHREFWKASWSWNLFECITMGV